MSQLDPATMGVVATAARAAPAGPVPAPALITAVYVDPVELAHLGFRFLAGRYPDLSLVGECRSAHQAPAVIRRNDPTVVLIGDGLPEQGRALAAELRAAHPRLGLVAIPHSGDDLLLHQARVSGVSAYVSRSAPVTAVVAAVRHAAQAPTTFRAFGVPWHVERAAAHAPALSQREQQVLARLRDGCSVEAIATTLGLRPGTVRTYVSRIYAKLDVTNRAQAMVATAGRPTGR